MSITIIDGAGNPQTWEWVQARYGEVTIAPISGEGFRVTQLTEVISGWMGFTCTVLNSAGGAVVGQQVAYMWPGGEQVEITNGSGTAEHTAGGGEGYAPPAVGPVSWEVRGAASERISGLGWLFNTNHYHLQVTMQWSGGGEPPPDDGDIAAAIRYLADTIKAGIPITISLA